MSYADIEKRRTYHREYAKKWRLAHPEEAKRAYERFYRNMEKYTPEQMARKSLRRRVRNRVRAFLVLGGKCRMCGETDFRVLTVNHINGDGYKDRHQPEQKYVSIKNFKRDDLELLCWNCQNLFEWDRGKKNYSTSFKEMLKQELRDHKIEQDWF